MKKKASEIFNDAHAHLLIDTEDLILQIDKIFAEHFEQIKIKNYNNSNEYFLKDGKRHTPIYGVDTMQMFIDELKEYIDNL